MAKSKFYSVANGRLRGVFATWEECKASVHGFSGAIYKSFDTREQALQHLTLHQPATPTASSSSGSSGTTPTTTASAVASGLEGATTSPSVASSLRPQPSRGESGSTVGWTVPTPAHHHHYQSPSSSLSPFPVVLPHLPITRSPVVASTSASSSSPGHPSSSSSSVLAAWQMLFPVVNVYVDGSCIGNGKSGARGGYGVFYGDGDPRNVSLPLLRSEKQTNNRGELKAMITVLQQSLEDIFSFLVTEDDEEELGRGRLERFLSPPPPPPVASSSSERKKEDGRQSSFRGDGSSGSAPAPPPLPRASIGHLIHPQYWKQAPVWYAPLHIHSDSKYCIDGLQQYLPNWRMRNFSNVENVDLWRELDYLVSLRRRVFSQIEEEALKVGAWMDEHRSRLPNWKAPQQGGKVETIKGNDDGAEPTSRPEEQEEEEQEVRLFRCRDSAIVSSQSLVLHYVKAHAGHYGNEQADRLAVLGSQKGLLQDRGAGREDEVLWRSFFEERRGVELFSCSLF